MDLQQATGTSLKASVTALSSLAKVFDWTIDKTVTPSVWDLFSGDSGTSQYTVTVEKDEGTSIATITGRVCVTNTGRAATQNLSITLGLERNPNGGFEPVPLPSEEAIVDISARPVLGPRQGFCYSYSITVPEAQVVPGDVYRVTAKVRITNHSGSIGQPFGPSPRATTTLPLQPTTTLHNSITITDSDGETFPENITQSTTFNYKRTFTCGTDEGIHVNTAYIIYEDDRTTGSSSSATVTVNCHTLMVSKTADTSYSRNYSWSINKKISSDQINYDDTANFILGLGEMRQAYYRVKVSPTSTEGDFMVKGKVTITNPAPVAATINSVTDTILGFGEIPVTCGDISFPYTLAGGGAITCTYEAILPDKGEKTNRADVTIQNYDYPFDLSDGTPSGTTDFNSQEQIIFSNTPTKIYDRCVSISDNLNGTIGQADALNIATQTIAYNGQVGPFSTCGSREVVNTAAFTPVICCDNCLITGNTGSNTATAILDVSCGGCVYTIYYWPFHPDVMVNLLPQWLGNPGGKSVYVDNPVYAFMEIIYPATLPGQTNGIYVLYGELLTAKMNISNGASSAPIASIITAADAFLFNYSAADWDSLTSDQVYWVWNWGAYLSNYNNGFSGVPACTDNAVPSNPTNPDNGGNPETENSSPINVSINNSRNINVNINCKEVTNSSPD